MGTSQSSPGAPSGVPMVPPWVPDVPQPDNQGNDEPDQQAQDESTTPSDQSEPPVAPPGRFGPSRTSLGKYANSGSASDMRRGLGHYIRRGLGGAGTATRRFGGTAHTAGALYGALSSTASGRTIEQGSPLDPAILAGRPAYDIMDALVETVCPTDGTQDAESRRKAIGDALSDLLNRFPTADLLKLNEVQIVFAIERFVGLDVFNRFRLDVGKSVQDRAPNATTALARLKAIKEYIKETVSEKFRQIRTSGQSLNASRIIGLVSQSLSETFKVFEDYVS